jgi:hypothetical protein
MSVKTAIDMVEIIKALDDLMLRKSGALELPTFWPYKNV